VPAGLWDAHEYEKLPDYDGEIIEQIEKGATHAFQCHQAERLCAGWTAVHKGCLAMRLYAEHMDEEEVRATARYETDVPLFSSGAEAALHGLSGVASPSDEAVLMIHKLERRLRGKTADR
jgi:hypothetical protein